MEIKAELKQPYTENERVEFIVKQNHELGYTIEEREDRLVALGYTLEELQQQEQERISKLSMTRGDVFEALILAKGLGKTQIRTMIEQAELDTVTKALYLNRFDEALEFYRGYPIFDMLGQALGITGEMLDKFFDTKDYHYLTTCKLTINATPENATIVINSEITSEATIPYGSVVDYVVSCDGYESKCGVFEITKDEVLGVVLDEDTTDTTTGIPNEVEAEPTGDVNTDKN